MSVAGMPSAVDYDASLRALQRAQSSTAAGRTTALASDCAVAIPDRSS